MSVRNLQTLFAARHVATLGVAETPVHFQILEHLAQSAGALQQYPRVPRRLDGPVDLALVFAASAIDVDGLHRLLDAGCRALIWSNAQPVPLELLRVARSRMLRVIGPRSVGLLAPGRLNASALEATPKGRVALIAQSGSVAAAAMDWAAGRNIGFSWVVTTGAEADADVGDFLDVAALDPSTRAVVLQLSHLHGARKFMSAARACARAKPVVVLQSRLGEDDGHVGADPVRSAAFARAGLVEVTTMDEMFDALAAVDRLPSPRDMRVLIVGNGAGVCALGIDAVRRYGLEAANCAAPTREQVAAIDARARWFDGGVDLGPVTPDQQVAALRAVLADRAVDCVLLLHSPYTGQAHTPFAEAVVAAELGQRVVTVWLGLASTGDARRLCADAGVPTFVSAGQAARGLRYRNLHRRTQEMLMQTPPELTTYAFERARARQLVDQALRSGWVEMRAEPARQLLACYGLQRMADPYAVAMPGLRLHVQLRRHREFGMYLSVSAETPGLRTKSAYGFPPLDLLLSERISERLGLTLDAAARRRLAGTALPLSQLALDIPEVVALSLHAAVDLDGNAALLPGATVRLDPDPPAARRRLALAPYPGDLASEVTLNNGMRLQVRPIRPEDEPGLIDLLESLDPEEVRLRFFHVIRHFSHEMAARMTQIDYDREIAFVAIDASDGPARIVGTSHLIADADGLEAEYSVLVRSDVTRIGLGRHLMQRLLDYAAAQRISTVFGEVLAENKGMLDLAGRLGFQRRMMPSDPGCVRVEWHPPT